MSGSSDDGGMFRGGDGLSTRLLRRTSRRALDRFQILPLKRGKVDGLRAEGERIAIPTQFLMSTPVMK